MESTITRSDESMENVIVNAEKHAAWGRIGLFDEDELLDRLEMRLLDNKKYQNFDIDNIESC